jgi:DNA-binding response OmpR family regulator
MKLITVIDDDLMFCNLLGKQLQALGYSLLAFHSVDEFLKAKKKKPMAIILDHFLGGKEIGIDFMREIKKKIPGVPIIYLTSLSGEKLPPDLYEAGALTYINKNTASLVKLKSILERIEESESKGWWQSIKKTFWG